MSDSAAEFIARVSDRLMGFPELKNTVPPALKLLLHRGNELRCAVKEQRHRFSPDFCGVHCCVSGGTDHFMKGFDNFFFVSVCYLRGKPSGAPKQEGNWRCNGVEYLR